MMIEDSITQEQAEADDDRHRKAQVEKVGIFIDIFC